MAIFDIKTTKPLRIIRCNEDEEYFGCDYNRYLAVLKSGMIELYEGEIIK